MPRNKLRTWELTNPRTGQSEYTENVRTVITVLASRYPNKARNCERLSTKEAIESLPVLRSVFPNDVCVNKGNVDTHWNNFIGRGFAERHQPRHGQYSDTKSALTGMMQFWRVSMGFPKFKEK